MKSGPDRVEDLNRKKSGVTLFVAVLALSAGAGGFAGGLYIELARIAAAGAFLIQIIVESRGKSKEFLTSPLFILSGIGAIFFSVAQGIWGLEMPHGPIRNEIVFVGSRAEAIILSFCMAGLVFYLFASRKGDEGAIAAPEFSNRIIVFLFTLTAAVSGLDAAAYALNIHALPVPPLLSKANVIAPPLISLSLCLLTRCAPARGRYFRIAVFILTVASLGALVYVHEGKLVLFILAALVLYTVRLFGFSFPQMILALLAALLVTLAFVQAVQTTRWKVSSGSVEKSASYLRIFKSKGVWRQTQTGYCFGNVLKVHAGDSFDVSKQAFWIKALVPRILWPGKPSLSLGGRYAADYCAASPATLANGQSASITLLGQPVIQGGIIGLIVHAGFLLFILAGLEKFNANRAASSTAMITALLPWLIDFDQDYSMYIANAVKFSLIMAVLFIPLAMTEHRTRRAG